MEPFLLGYVCTYKRLSQGTFAWEPATEVIGELSPFETQPSAITFHKTPSFEQGPHPSLSERREPTSAAGCPSQTARDTPVSVCPIVLWPCTLASIG